LGCHGFFFELGNCPSRKQTHDEPSPAFQALLIALKRLLVCRNNFFEFNAF
jgi:hypothetical protein